MGTGYTRNDTSNNIADGNIINASDLDGEFDAVESAFNSSTGHTHDGTAAEGGAITVVGPVQDLVVSATEVKPKTTNTLDLGTSGLLYKDAYLQGNMYFRDTALKIVSSADGQLDIDADVELELVAPTVDIDASTAVTIDTATLTVTGSANVVGDLDVDNININGNTIISTDTNGNIALTPNGTGEVDISKVDIDSGAIDGTVIGANSAAAITGTTITGTSFVTSGDMTFGDSDKAIFGAGSDLQIYHDGSHSYIDEQGTGNLRLRGSNFVQILDAAGNDMIQAEAGNNVQLYYNASAKLATTNTGVDVTGTVTADGLTVDGASVFNQAASDQSGGAAVKANGTAYGTNKSIHAYMNTTNANRSLIYAENGAGAVFNVDGSGNVDISGSSGATLKLTSTDTSGADTELLGQIDFVSSDVSGGSAGTQARIKGVYEDNGDSSGIAFLTGASTGSGSPTLNEVMRIRHEGNVGIGTSSPLTLADNAAPGLTISSNGPFILLKDANNANNIRYISNNTGEFQFGKVDDDGTSNKTEHMRIDSSGNLLVGTTSANFGGSGRGVIELNGSSDSLLSLKYGNTAGLYLYTASGEGRVAQFANLPMTFFTNNTERMRIDSSGNVGIGTSSPGELLHCSLPSGTNGDIVRLSRSASAYSFQLGVSTGVTSNLYISDNSNNKIIDFTSSGNVGIGITNPVYNLVVSAGGASGIEFGPAYSGTANLVQHYSRSGASYVDAVNVAAQHRFSIGANEKMRILSTGDIAFGNTVANTVSGYSNQPGGGYVASDTHFEFATTSNRSAVEIGKNNANDGQLVAFRKQNTTVGSIASEGGNSLIVQGGTTGGAGLHYHGNSFSIVPARNNARIDNVIDLGTATNRFDDIYATNGTIQTSDANEKQQIAALTDAEITAAKSISALFKTFKWNDAVAEKGDAARTHAGVIAQDVQAAMTAAGLDAGDYAFFISSTWWETQTEVPAVEADEENGIEAVAAYTRTDTFKTAEEAPEGAVERTRLGIRYPELLAFVGAATEQRLANIETRLAALEAN